MSALAELNTLLDGLKIKVETGIFKGKAPDTYTVLTPLSDTDELFADNTPQLEVQEVSISIYTKGSYTALRQSIVKALRKADFTITSKRYIGYETDTEYHHYEIDVAKEYEIEEE